MKEISGVVVFSPTDLSSFLACRRKTAFDHAKMRGELQLPARDESFLEILRDRGIQHEKQFIDGERANGHEVVDLSPKDAAGKERQGFETRDLQIAATLGAMHRG